MNTLRGPRFTHLGPAEIAALRKQPDQHKYDHGHGLILTGGAGKTGAARMAARAALRIGAGLVTLAVPGSAKFEVAAQITAEMLTRIDQADDLTGALQDLRINALCLGPGFGLGQRETGLLEVAISAQRPIVVDADAITLLAQASDMTAKLHQNCILTPHMGEFSRLCPNLATDLQNGADRGEVVALAAQELGCVLLLKGTCSFIASPGGAVFCVDASGVDADIGAAPWLATAGSGDVLAGFVTGLLARGFAPIDAARIGVLIHLRVGQKLGAGLIASDLPEAVPQVFRDLGI